MGTIILPNVKIGNDVIIGAGSVVCHDLPSGTVCAGVPAKVLYTLEDYKKRILINKDKYPIYGFDINPLTMTNKDKGKNKKVNWNQHIRFEKGRQL